MRTVAEPVLSYSQRLWFATVLLICGFVVLLIGCSHPRMAGDVPSQMDPAVAKLVKVVDGDVTGYCTVFKVGENLAMSAGHCCGVDDAEDDVLCALLDTCKKDKKKPVVTYHAEGVHAVPGAAFEVLYDDDTNDVCVLEGKMTGAPLAIGDHDPAIGSRVWTAGYPMTHLLYSDGLWSGREQVGDSNYSKASVAVWGGASGSPVMDGNGRVVGVLVAMFRPMSNLALIAPIEWVRVGMKTAQAKRK